MAAEEKQPETPEALIVSSSQSLSHDEILASTLAPSGTALEDSTLPRSSADGAEPKDPKIFRTENGIVDGDASQQARLPYIEGLRLWILITALCLGLLLSTVEQTIVGTALISIASELGEYGRSSWVVTAYLMTFNGFLIVFARCSDIFGRRSAFLMASIIFVVFSLACGLAQSMNQLIIFRAFQGAGGAGLFSLAMGVATEVPGSARTAIQGLLTAIFAISSGAGPLIGGAIVSYSSWRWVFYLNVPIGVVQIVVAFWVFPKNAVPLHFNFQTLGLIDWPGITLYLGAVVSLNFALQQGGTVDPWNSAPIVIPLVVQGVCWVAFVGWEINLTVRGTATRMLPIWPARLFARRVVGCAMLTAFLSGISIYSVNIYLPQRFQLANGLSPVDAGVRMLVLLVVSSVATGLGASICVVINIVYPILVVGFMLQILGLGLMSSLPADEAVLARQYGYQTILGFGFGLSLSAIPVITRLELSHLDHAVNMAAVSSLRTLGGTIGIAIGSIVLSSQVYSRLGDIISPEQAMELLQSTDVIAEFTPTQITAVRTSFGSGYNFDFRLIMYFSIAALLVSLGCFVRHPLQIRDVDEKETRLKALLDAQARENAGLTAPIPRLTSEK